MGGRRLVNNGPLADDSNHAKTSTLHYALRQSTQARQYSHRNEDLSPPIGLSSHLNVFHGIKIG